MYIPLPWQFSPVFRKMKAERQGYFTQVTSVIFNFWLTIWRNREVSSFLDWFWCLIKSSRYTLDFGQDFNQWCHDSCNFYLDLYDILPLSTFIRRLLLSACLFWCYVTPDYTPEGDDFLVLHKAWSRDLMEEQEYSTCQIVCAS